MQCRLSNNHDVDGNDGNDDDNMASMMMMMNAEVVDDKCRAKIKQSMVVASSKYLTNREHLSNHERWPNSNSRGAAAEDDDEDDSHYATKT